MVQIPSWMHSTFKDLSNEYSHAQIRVKMKKLWPRQVGEEKQVAVRKYVATRKVCRDRNCVATGNVLRPVSRQAVCRDRCRDKQYVATSVATSSMSRSVSRPESFVATTKLCRNQKR